MSLPTTFTIYNASAGSGKTFTLVKEYLKILLQSEDLYKFQEILAVTFTNKAANEMKERVLNNLTLFSEGNKNDLFLLIQNELQIDSKLIQDKSKKILEAILQNYTAFSITTIDSFTHKIIKSFAFDLGISQSFEVEMDTDQLLKQAIDILISKIGLHQEITQTLLAYAKDKSNDDSSWEIDKDLFEFSKLLFKEDDYKNLKKIEHKTLLDFQSLQKKIKIQNREIEKNFTKIGEKGIDTIRSLGLDFSDFYGGYFPKLLVKFKEFETTSKKELSFSNTLIQIFNQEKPAYAQKVVKEKKEIIDNNFTLFKELFTSAKNQYSNFLMNMLVLKSIIPLAVLKFVNQELQQIKEESNIQLNAEFNYLISKSIQNQPAPYIYERIGNKFRHYFIDEMQDTSQLQWQNLIPLLHNTLSQENSSLLLVGDGKQSIYRWRGGKAEQFIDFGNPDDKKNPFTIPKKVEELKINYRSFTEIIEFNNQFFAFASQYLNKPTYRELFEKRSYQESKTDKTGGFVSINFLEHDKEVEKIEITYAKKVLEIIQNLKSDFSLSEICIITRKKVRGVVIANYLLENEIPITSSESLLLQNSAKVNFLIDLLSYSLNKTEEIKFQLLYFLHDYLQVKESQHNFFYNSLKLDDFFAFLASFQLEFNESYFAELPLYEKMEYAIQSFGFMKTSDAYVQFFLDEILQFQQKEFGVQNVLEFWEIKKDKLSIVSPQEENAVQIMTIHKSKGLEFPVVIFPENVDVYYQKNPKVWLQNSLEEFEDFLIPYNSSLESIPQTQSIYNNRKEELELDSLNLLYVTLTRAKEQLYIVSETTKFNSPVTKHFSQYFKEFLESKNLYKEGTLDYQFGKNNRHSKREENEEFNHFYQENFHSISKEKHQINLLASSSKLWGTEQKDAILYGNFIHEILSKIKSIEELEEVLNNQMQKGIITFVENKELKTKLSEVLNHPKLIQYYGKGVKILNERMITDFDGQLFIPDRLVFQNNIVIILDYKTGEKSESHIQQLLKYERVLKSMGYKNIKKVLVYLKDRITVEEF